MRKPKNAAWYSTIRARATARISTRRARAPACGSTMWTRAPARVAATRARTFTMSARALARATRPCVLGPKVWFGKIRNPQPQHLDLGSFRDPAASCAFRMWTRAFVGARVWPHTVDAPIHIVVARTRRECGRAHSRALRPCGRVRSRALRQCGRARPRAFPGSNPT